MLTTHWSVVLKCYICGIMPTSDEKWGVYYHRYHAQSALTRTSPPPQPRRFTAFRSNMLGERKLHQ